VLKSCNMPLVSIITVCYNSANTLEHTINSVISQTHKNIEYIIIDGGSTDGTQEIIKKYERYINYWVSEKDEGIYDAINKGISVSTGELVGIINSDDWYNDNAVEIIVNEYMSQRENDILHGNSILHFKESQYLVLPLLDINRVRYRMPLNHPACFVTKRAYESYGCFDVKYKIAADYELMLRFYLKGAKFMHVNKVISHMRTGGISWSTTDVFYETRDIAVRYGSSSIIANAIMILNICKRFSRNVIHTCKLDILFRLQSRFKKLK